MEIRTQGEVIELLIKVLPYSNQIKNIDISKERALYFDWRSGRYKIDIGGNGYFQVDRVEGLMLIRDDCSILIKKLIEVTQFHEYSNK